MTLPASCHIRRVLMAAAIALILPAFPASALDLTRMTDEERQIFRDEVRAYLMDHPEVLLEAIAVLEDRQTAVQTASESDLLDQHRAAIFEDGHSFVGGNPDGDVTLVEFIDYRCSFCRRAHPEVRQLIEEDGNIRLIVKEFPILGEDSVMSARFAIAVLDIAGPETYARAHERLISLRGAATRDSLSGIARDLGLDPATVLARMETPEVGVAIERNHALARALQITGTPTFIVEDQFLRGYAPLAVMESLVEEARGG